MTINVEIDQAGCIQCGLCYNDECPKVFKERDDGTSEIVDQYQSGSPAKGTVPDDLNDCVKKAADACPVTVIIINP